jgi:hypothetical protein
MASYYDSNKATSANSRYFILKDSEEQHFPFEGLYIGSLTGGEMEFPALVDINEVKAARVWRAKFDQVLMKGRSLRGDSEFTLQLDYYENQMKENDAESKKIFGIKLFG